MKIVYLLFSLLQIVSPYAILLHRTRETPFMQMNKDCFMFPGQELICDNLNTAIDNDPFYTDDVKTVCKRSKVNNFTNEDLANLVNSRFDGMGFPCKIHTINNSSSTQFRNQCTEIYTRECTQNI